VVKGHQRIGSGLASATRLNAPQLRGPGFEPRMRYFLHGATLLFLHGSAWRFRGRAGRVVFAFFVTMAR
jgi:hypothetical protein